MAGHGRPSLLVAEALVLEKSLRLAGPERGVTGRDIDTLSDLGSNSPITCRRFL